VTPGTGKLAAALTMSAGLLLAAFIPANAAAAGDKDITLYCRQDETILSGMEWSLYRVGTRDGSNVDLIPELDGYSMDLGDLSAEAVDTAAKTLSSYIIAAGISPISSGYTDTSGEVGFDGLSSGLYLVKGTVLQVDDKWYFPSTMLVEINDTDQSQSQDVYPKFYFETDTDDEKSYTVKKVWAEVWADDETGTIERPASITVDLYKDAELFDTVILDEGNSWTYTWESLEAGAEWTVTEHEVPEPYQVTIDSNRSQFLIINTVDPDFHIISGDDDITTTPTAAAVTEIVTNDTSGEPVTTTVSTQTTAAVTTGPVETTPGKLAQTGQLWWPVIPLSLGGVLLIGTGIILNSGKKKDEE
jgi:hypothetical protein